MVVVYPKMMTTERSNWVGWVLGISVAKTWKIQRCLFLTKIFVMMLTHRHHMNIITFSIIDINVTMDIIAIML